MIPQNKKSGRQRDLETNLIVNPIEDGNTPASGFNQGYIYTSEINDNAGYEYAYLGQIYTITQEKGTTGNDYYYVIEVGYELENDNPLATQDGFFGSNLIKVGEPFIIKNDGNGPNFNFIKGYIVSIINVNPAVTPWPDKLFVYTIRIAITEGDMSVLNDNGSGIYPALFCTNRRIFTDDIKEAPMHLNSYVDKASNQILFSWVDPTNMATSYRLRVRDEFNAINDYYVVTGNNPNFNGILEPIVEGGVLQSIKIVNSGYSYSLTNTFLGGNPVNIKCNEGATLPLVFIYPDYCGSLTIEDYLIVDVFSISSNQVGCTLMKKNNIISPGAFNLPIDSMYVEFGNEFGSGYIIPGGTYNNDKYSLQITYNGSVSYTLSQAQTALIGKTIKVHTGAYVDINNKGSNITKILLSYDKYKDGTKYKLDYNPLFWGGTYYFSLSSVFDCKQKTFSEWSEEMKFIV